MKAELTLFEAQFSLFYAGYGLLLCAANKVGLLDNRPTGYFDATIVKAGMQQGTLFDAYFSFVQKGVDGANAAEIIVFLLENEMYMDYLSHIVAI